MPPTAASDLTSALYEVLDATIEMQGADFGNVQLYEESSETLNIVAHRGLDQKFLDYFAIVDVRETSACGLALRSGTRITIEDVNTDPDFEPQLGIAASTGIRALQSTPLIDRHSGKPLGMLSTHFRQPYRPPARELRLTDLFARQAADLIAFRVLEQRTRDSEARLSAIVAQFPGAFGLFDAEGRLLLRGGALSSLWTDITPSQEAELARRWRALDANGGIVPPASFPGARALRGETVTPGVDFLRTWEDGRETWIRVSAAPFRNDAGVIIGAIGTLQDVDDEKRARQRLEESEARLQAAVDLLKLGRYSWDPQNNELQWDEAVRAMWGLPPDMPEDFEVWRAGVHPEDLPRVEQAIKRCADPRSDGVYDIEYRVIRRNDGVERWIATRGQTWFENGRPARFYGVALDVSDRKQLELNLERRVEERTLELEAANRHLRSQIRQREAAEAEVRQLQRLEAIGQITTGVAHDFNNLLTIVLGHAHLLSLRSRASNDQESIALIRSAAERGAKLTAQLLAFSRRQRLESQDVDLNAKIGGMRELLSATLGGTIQLQTELATALCHALVDPSHLESIVLNLAINARDAMPSGGVLTIRTFNAAIDDGPFGPEGPAPGRYACLAVDDTGVGIPEAVLPRVFEPFFTTKEPGKGSGLGLAQVFGFAKQSGGGVLIDTRVGVGTSVKVFMPCVEVIGEYLEQELVDAAPDPQTKLKTVILVVDDDDWVLRTTVRMIETLGFEAVPAASGAAALRLIDSGVEVGLVLADFAMPGMTGVELAKTIHAEHPDLPVIIVTGYGDHAVLRDCGEAILQKPFAENELNKKIAAALR